MLRSDEASLRRGRDDGALDDGGDVGDGVPDVDAHAGDFADGVERGDGALRDVQARDVEGLEHHLREALAIGAAREQRLGHERGALVPLHPPELAVEDVRVHALELVPVHDAAVHHGAEELPVPAPRAANEAGLQQRIALGDGVPRPDEIVVVVDDDDVLADRRHRGDGGAKGARGEEDARARRRLAGGGVGATF